MAGYEKKLLSCTCLAMQSVQLLDTATEVELGPDGGIHLVGLEPCRVFHAVKSTMFSFTFCNIPWRKQLAPFTGLRTSALTSPAPSQIRCGTTSLETRLPCFAPACPRQTLCLVLRWHACSWPGDAEGDCPRSDLPVRSHFETSNMGCKVRLSGSVYHFDGRGRLWKEEWFRVRCTKAAHEPSDWTVEQNVPDRYPRLF